MKLVASFGSCLSANVAHNLSKIYSEWCRVSSVQHNRIDQFNDIFIEKKFAPLKKTDLNFELQDKFSYVNTIDNQLKDVGLGKALPKKDDKIPLTNFLDCMSFGKIDLFIFDNFAELLFKLYRHKILHTPMFINEKYLTTKANDFEFVNDFISNDSLSYCYRNIFKIITNLNPRCKIVFIPFPVNLKNDKNLNARSGKYFDSVVRLKEANKNLYILPNSPISEVDLQTPNDIYHFTEACYINYARSTLKNII